jgi:uncharacterized protein
MEPRKISCPKCGQLTVFSESNPFRPFCSERCRLLDLGQWADEAYKIPTQTHVDLNIESSDTDVDSED